MTGLGFGRPYCAICANRDLTILCQTGRIESEAPAMRTTAQPPDPGAPPPANGCGGRFELALVAAFKAGSAPPPGGDRGPRG